MRITVTGAQVLSIGGLSACILGMCGLFRLSATCMFITNVLAYVTDRYHLRNYKRREAVRKAFSSAHGKFAQEEVNTLGFRVRRYM